MSLNIQTHENHAVLTLSAPPRNLLDGELLASLLSALADLERTGSPPLLLRAEGRHFSTGYPIDEIPEDIFHADPDRRAAVPFERVMAALSGYPAPVLAAIQGDAYGGAVELLCCADLRVGAHDIRFAVPAVRLGLIYSLSGMRRLRAAFGSAHAREMLLTGEPISARRAFRGGFLNRLVAPERLEETCDLMMGNLLRGAPMALRGTRRVLKALEAADGLDEGITAEIAEARHASWSSEDFREAQRAFLEKRRPEFKGR
jgi:enoyl-CoA hydratase/carnithine racemase